MTANQSILSREMACVPLGSALVLISGLRPLG
jgi:hypothetical protein